MKKFEYITETQDESWNFTIGSDDESSYLLDMGKKGWELVNVIGPGTFGKTAIYYFKRELLPERERIDILSKEKVNQLVELLLSVGFQKKNAEVNNVKQILFSFENEMFVFPENLELRLHHLISTRKHLDANGHMEELEFNDKIGIEQVGEKYYWK